MPATWRSPGFLRRYESRRAVPGWQESNCSWHFLPLDLDRIEAAAPEKLERDRAPLFRKTCACSASALWTGFGETHAEKTKHQGWPRGSHAGWMHAESAVAHGVR